MPGCSGTPLAKKLGIKAGSELLVVNAPADYAEWLAPLPDGVHFAKRLASTTDLVHLFVTRRAELGAALRDWRPVLKTDGAVWVSWPKIASKVPSEVTEDTVREIALPLGFVDVKVCAVSEIWSGLKLVIRKSLR